MIDIYRDQVGVLELTGWHWTCMPFHHPVYIRPAPPCPNLEQRIKKEKSKPCPLREMDFCVAVKHRWCFL